MQSITTTTRGLCVTYFLYTVIIATVSYQHCSHLYYLDIHLHRYIFWYCILTYDDSVIFIMLYFKLSRNFSFLTNIESVHLWYFQTQLFAADKVIHHLRFLIINNKCRNQVPVIKVSQHWNKKYYRRSADCFEGDLDLDINCLDSDNLWKYTTVPSQCDQLPWTWMWCLFYFYNWYRLEKGPGSV